MHEEMESGTSLRASFDEIPVLLALKKAAPSRFVAVPGKELLLKKYTHQRTNTFPS